MLYTIETQQGHSVVWYVRGRFWGEERRSGDEVCDKQKDEVSVLNFKVCHPNCVRSGIQSCIVYISIYTYSHEHNNITFSGDI